MRTRIAAAALAAAALLTLTACSSSDKDDAKATTTTVTPTVDTSSIEAAAGIPTAPTGVQRTAYLAALKVVDSQLAGDPDKAISNGRNQCSTLNGGGANPDHLAAERFGTSSHTLTDAQGKAINATLRATLCPKS